ncbi:ABC transporter [Iodidimonas nitroreducens]|uniref:ABC transporter n=1 Tax=Iodidimonas nitroreducens TaxID=1236968 RepID=A0A5A7N772_9PROT|nr:ABC transporter ATP-binding protein [Iodidimonas nitroreducens]GAK32419.1 Fe(3+) ions import ATP-binding protein FbpC 2 [alpha proteobacterium Q-1]GER03220.1 ABC transporter [Iodidimonas nitroreducens]
MSFALDLHGLGFAYDGRDVVLDVSFSVAAGEIVCLLGPSGCGKTTTLRIAAGLERPGRGSVYVGGRQVAGPGVHEPPERRHIGLVLQDFALFPHLTVADNVAFGLKKMSRSDRQAVVYELLAQVGLLDEAKAWPHQLSGGQQQRVALIRALAPRPHVMLMDEPFSGLDVTLRADVRQRAVEVLKSRAVPTLIVTHDPDEALAVADRILIMRDGQIVQSGTPEEVYLNPVDPFVMNFFGAPNRLAGTVRNGCVRTLFGDLDAKGLQDGANVSIYFRGQALHVSQSPEALIMRVKDARLLGPVQRLVLETPQVDTHFIMVQSRQDALKIGDDVRISANLNHFQLFLQQL